ncbi:MAG: Rpn family recombination-promoting nuclease/putative transposase [Lachnospiraceae bacterium]|nr:Rpn family recombination-promoting nuclease/putative transposase [Lachnospiraceae bacterium]
MDVRKELQNVQDRPDVPDIPESEVNTPHDKGYRKSLSNPKEFLHFLKKYVGDDWTKKLKVSDLSLCDTKMLEKDYQGREADLIYKAHLPGDEDVFIFILQELQSSVDYTMIFRVLMYVVNTLLKHFLNTPENVRESAKFRLPAMVPIIFYNGSENWTAVKSLKEYQNCGELFGDHVLNLKYYLIDLSELKENYILSTNTVLDNIMYCDKFRKRDELAEAIRTSYKRIETLGAQEKEEFRNWVKYILLSICGNKKAVMEEILNWAGKGEDDMAFKYNIIKAFEDERAEGQVEGELRKVISQVRKKVSRNMSAEEIADMLEEDIKLIFQICNAIKSHPDLDDEQISQHLSEHSS